MIEHTMNKNELIENLHERIDHLQDSRRQFIAALGIEGRVPVFEAIQQAERIAYEAETTRLMSKHQINVIFGDGSLTISSRWHNVAFVIYGENCHDSIHSRVRAYADIL